jgi:integrase
VTKEGVLTRLATATRRSSTLGKRPCGDKPLRALKHSDVLQALAAHPRLAGKTVNNWVSVLREALALAVLDRLLPDNPAAVVPSAHWQPAS